MTQPADNTPAVQNVPLPSGADLTWLDDWTPNGESTYRLIWSHPIPGWSEAVDGFADADVRVVVTQFADGTIGTAGDDKPLIYCGSDDRSVSSARNLAHALTAAADLAERWTSGQPSNAEALATARSAVERAHAAVQLAPGNAGDYLRAALDSIRDAQEALR